MNRIKILSEEVANRIAAGEVVERPVSVVKELVENSIDAGADNIIIKIESGGKKSIEIIDNGCGMSEDDALQAFERHATSKIHTVADIFEISTLGFRGEALPSIASVSKLTLITKTKDADIATRVEFRGGQLRNVTKTSGKTGTTVRVERLFSNVPARKKFLKSNRVEFKHILNYLHYQSIVHPKISFKFISNNKEKLNYPIAKDVEHRLKAVFGSNFFKRDLIRIDVDKTRIKLKGYVGGLEEEPEGFSTYRYLFVNGRFIKDKVIYHSIKAAYKPFIQKLRIFKDKQTPPFILFLEVEPRLVDFNVHPSKLEVRFKDTSYVHNFVKNILTEKLLEYENDKFENIQKKIQSSNKMGKATALENKIFQNKTEKKIFNQYRRQKDEEGDQLEFFRNKFDKDLANIKIDSRQKADLFLPGEEEIINPWQLHQTYIFVQVEEGLMIIDQHAAHERILYEKILHRIHGAPAETQKLLFPLVIDIPPYLMEIVPSLISDNMEVFEKIGFKIKKFSGNSIVINEIPAELEDWDGGEVFIDILKQLNDEFKETEDFRDSLAKSIACKAAIKAGKKMSRREMVALINDLFACEVPYFCPHGRPLIIKMTLDEFGKKFKRIV